MATRTFVDIDPLFLANPVTLDLGIRTDSRAIAFAIKNLILTTNGERPFNSAIGSSIKSILFELYGDQMKIVLKRIIADTISNFEPRVSLMDIVIDEDPDINKVFVSIHYKIKNTEQPYQVAITLQRTR